MSPTHRATPSVAGEFADELAGTGIDDNAAEHVDFDNFEGIGIPPRAAWYASAILYAAAVTSTSVLSLVTHLIPGDIMYFNAVGVAMVILCLVGAKRWTEARWGGHLRSSIGMTIVVTAALALGDVHSATSIATLYPMVITSYIYGPRESLPYVVVGTLWLAGSLIFLVPDATARGIATGLVVGGITMMLVRSQTELRAIVRINRDLSVTDALTGVANVRSLRDRLAAALSGATPEARVALFGIDLDDFKLVNDRFSHTRGDEVLKAVVDEIQAVLKEQDLLARRGGDEFSVVVTDSRDRDLEELEVRIAKAIEVARMRVCPEVNPRGSVAHVTHVPGESVDAFLERCDTALHESKLNAHPERRGPRGVISLDASRRWRARTATSRSDEHVSVSRDTAANEQQMAKALQRALGSASGWNAAAVLCLVSSLAVIGLLMTRTGTELTAALPLAAAVGLLVLALLARIGAKRGLSGRWVHLQLITMTALIALAVWFSGPLRAPLADLYLAPMVGAAYALSSRQSIPHIAICLILFAFSLAAGDYGMTTTRVAMTAVVALVMLGMLSKARRVTHTFTRHAARLSTVDALTGLANLRGLRRGVGDAVSRCRRSGDTLALLTVDLDEFKLVNDLYSHTMGDKVLVEVAKAMTDAVRETDLVARRGGDEFAIVVTVDDERELGGLRDRLAASISGVRAKLTPDIVPTASIGTVVWSGGEDTDAFLTRADAELHEAKLDSRRLRDGSAARRSA